MIRTKARKADARQRSGTDAPATAAPAPQRAQLLQRALAFHRAGRLPEAAAGYRTILETEPRNADVLTLLGTTNMQLGNVEMAVQLIGRSLQINPRQPAALNNYGVALQQLDRHEDALASFAQAIALKADYAEAFVNRGVALQNLKRSEEALASFDRAIGLRAGFAKTYNSRGITLQSLGRYDEAVASFDRAIALRPDFAEACNNRGVALQKLKRHEEALASFERAIALKADYADAFSNRGHALRELGRREGALASFDRAVALNPANADAFYNRGTALQELERQEEALASFDRAIALKPDFTEALNNRGIALRMLDRYEEAVASFDGAIALNAGSAAAFNNRAAALRELGRHGDALASLERAIALNAHYPEAFNSRSIVLKELERYDDALASADRAIALKADYAAAHLSKSLLHLLRGNYADGWRLYDWRWRVPEFKSGRRNFAQPSWSGDQDLSGKTILLYAEQGLGDTLQFVRYVPLVAARGGRIVLEVQPPLASLLARLDGVANLRVHGETLPDFDYHCALMDLPRAFGTRLDTVPDTVPYLTPDPAQVAAWRERLARLGGRCIGLVWAGGSLPYVPFHNAVDRRRSVTLAHFAPLAAVSGVSFVSLQKGGPAAQARTPPAGMVVHDWTEELHDFADTAALIAALDLVISVDTAVAHAAGALARPIWMLNRFDTCWRWLVGRTDSPWYPTLRQFRQPRLGDWDAVMREVGDALAAYAR